MPLLQSYASASQAPGRRRQLAVSPGRESLIFLRPRSGGSAAREKWGELVAGWIEVEPAGIVGDVTTVRSTDEISGVPYVSGASPETGSVQINFNADQAIHQDILESHYGKVFEFRHVSAPPQMNVIHGDYLFSGGTRSAIGSDAGVTYTVNITPIPEMIDFGGAYYRSEPWDVGSAPGETDNALGIDCNKIVGSHIRSTTGADGSPGDVGVRIDSSGLIRFAGSPKGPVSNIPSTHAVQAMVYSPGIGYALSSVDPNGGTTQMSSFTFDDAEFGLALRANTPTIWVAIWAVPSSRGALR